MRSCGLGSVPSVLAAFRRLTHLPLKYVHCCLKGSVNFLLDVPFAAFLIAVFHTASRKWRILKIQGLSFLTAVSGFRVSHNVFLLFP